MELGKHLINLGKATLHPPRRVEDDDDAFAAGAPWVLLDLEAYVADHRNATTAYSHSESGKEIQVTFFLARPPRVSYFCVFCPGRDHTEIAIEPKILAVEENLVLLCIVVSPEKEIYRDRDFFIYQANGADNEGPLLHRLPRPPGRCFFDYSKVGLLRCNEDYCAGGSSVLRPHRVSKDEFIIAALCGMSEPGVGCQFTDEDFMPGPGDFALLVYNSKLGSWSAKVVSLDQQQLQKQPLDCFLHFNSKVITIGGDAGTMGFVDLWRGILLCDVLKGSAKLSYVPLPKPILSDNELMGDARLSRDIAFIEGCIKYVELQIIFNPSLFRNCRYANDGWIARRYSRPVAAADSVAAVNSSEDDWGVECEIESSDHINIVNNPHFKLLPRPHDNKGQPLPPFKSLVTCHPTLSLKGNDDDTVYFMNKIVPGDNKAWVMAVDMRTKELLGVAQFAAERTRAVTFAYVHSRISKYLTGASGAGTKGSLKRPGHMLMRYMSKLPSTLLALRNFLEHGSDQEDRDDMMLD